MKLTPERDAKVRRKLARMVAAGKPVPRHRTPESAAQRGGGANPAFIRLPPREK